MTPTHPPAAADYERIQCQWCQLMNPKGALSCNSCGAPLDIRNLVSESGWREAPRLRDMTEFHFGMSTCQVEGEIVPAAEKNKLQGEAEKTIGFVYKVSDEGRGEAVHERSPLAGSGEKRLGRPEVVVPATHAGPAGARAGQG